MSVWNRFSKEDIIFGMMVSHYTKDFLSYFLTLFPLIYSSFSTTSLAPVIKFPFFSTLLKRLFVTWMSSILTRSSYPVIKTPYLLLAYYRWETSVTFFTVFILQVDFQNGFATFTYFYITHINIFNDTTTAVVGFDADDTF